MYVSVYCICIIQAKCLKTDKFVNDVRLKPNQTKLRTIKLSRARAAKHVFFLTIVKLLGLSLRQTEFDSERVWGFCFRTHTEGLEMCSSFEPGNNRTHICVGQCFFVVVENSSPTDKQTNNTLFLTHTHTHSHTQQKEERRALSLSLSHTCTLGINKKTKQKKRKPTKKEEK